MLIFFSLILVVLNTDFSESYFTLNLPNIKSVACRRSSKLFHEPNSLNNYFNKNVKENGAKLLSFFSFLIAEKVAAEDRASLGKLGKHIIYI